MIKWYIKRFLVNWHIRQSEKAKRKYEREVGKAYLLMDEFILGK